MRINIFLLFITVFLFACQGSQENKDEVKSEDVLDTISNSSSGITRDLKEIQDKGVLKAITLYSSTNYFLYRGQPMGYEYELALQLANYLNLELELVIAIDIQDMVNKLKSGEGDIIAAGLTITNDRKFDLRFTNYLYLTKQILIERKPENWRKMMLHKIDEQLIKDPIGLIGDTVHVSKNSSFYERLKNLEEEIGGRIIIKPVGGDVGTEKLIAMVVDGEIKYTVADQNVASINASYYPILDVNTAISFSQRIAWAVRKDSPKLVDTINYWIGKMKKHNDFYTIYDRYYKSPRSFKQRIKSDFYSEKTGKISPYDDIIKKYCEPTGWDWRLVSSLIYQESRFNPKARSWAKANGLMQLMPATARELGVKNMNDPNDNIRGGVKYLNQLWNQWESIPDSIQRLKFTFASYNCGFYHVVDAQNLAKKFGLDPTIWDGNVEEQVMNLTYAKYYRDKTVRYGFVRGREPVSYVKEIFERYEHYKRFIEA